MRNLPFDLMDLNCRDFGENERIYGEGEPDRFGDRAPTSRYFKTRVYAGLQGLAYDILYPVAAFSKMLDELEDPRGPLFRHLTDEAMKTLGDALRAVDEQIGVIEVEHVTSVGLLNKDIIRGEWLVASLPERQQNQNKA